MNESVGLDGLELVEGEGDEEVDVGRGIWIVGEFVVVVIGVMVVGEWEGVMGFERGLVGSVEGVEVSGGF